MNKIKSFVEKFQMFITNLPKFEATGTESIGSLDPKETAQCYRKVGGSYLVVYNLSGTTKHKAGFVKYAGGVTSAPTASKTYKNGSTSETIYADTANKIQSAHWIQRKQPSATEKLAAVILLFTTSAVQQNIRLDLLSMPVALHQLLQLLRLTKMVPLQKPFMLIQLIKYNRQS